jgi:hypothetical protein
MRRKWVILAAVFFLGVVAWVAFAYEQKTFNLGQVHRAIKGFGSNSPGMNVTMDGENDVYPRTVRPDYLRSMVQWFREQLGMGIRGGIGSVEITEYVDTYRIRYPSGDVVVAVYWIFEDVEKMGRVGRVSRVEVRPDKSSGSQADRVRSELREQFPGLKCTIVKTN